MFLQRREKVAFVADVFPSCVVILFAHVIALHFGEDVRTRYSPIFYFVFVFVSRAADVYTYKIHGTCVRTCSMILVRTALVSGNG